MSRSRNIKPGFFTNADLLECQPLARLLFAGLWCEADPRGILEDRPKTLKIKLLPGDNCDVDALLDELVGHGFIERYEAAGVRCILVTNFERHQNPHQNERNNSLPAPESQSAQMHDASEQHQSTPMQAPEQHQSNREDSLNRIPDSTSVHPRPGKTANLRSIETNGETHSNPSFELFAALCDELGVDISDVSKAQKAKELGVAKRLASDGATPDEIRRQTRWLRGQSWIESGIDMLMIEKFRGRWQMAGRPDTTEAPIDISKLAYNNPRRYSDPNSTEIFVG